MTNLLPCVEINPTDPTTGDPGCVVWLHGLGANGHDFEPIVPHLGLPHARFVFPHAPNRPVTINGGLIMPAWYDITGAGPGGSNQRHIRETQEQIEAILERERETFPASRIVLAGFSQGGAIVLHVGVRHAHPLAGIMVLSAYELQPENREGEADPANASTPMLFCHGSQDPLVPVTGGKAASETFSSPDREVEWHEFPIAHEVSMPEIEVIGEWLRRRLF